MSHTGLVGPEALALVGTELRHEWGTVTRSSIQRYALAVGDDNPLLLDPDVARAAGHPGVVAPPLFVQFIAAEPRRFDRLQPDGTSSILSELPLPACPRRLAGGQDFTFGAPVHESMEIEARHVLESVREQQGRSGPFVLVRTVTDYRDRGSGALLATCATTYVARPPASAERESVPQPVSETAAQDPLADLRLGPLRIGAHQLFQFSAATFNAHRVHIDRDWAVRVEGYRDLLVHGTLRAALLARMVTAWAGPAGRLRTLALTHRRPAFCDEPLVFEGRIVRTEREPGREVVHLDLACRSGAGIVTPGTAVIERAGDSRPPASQRDTHSKE